MAIIWTGLRVGWLVVITTGRKGLEALKQQKELPEVSYPLRFKTTAEWMESPIPMDMKNGFSPGGASSELGVSRQSIYRWVQLGYLDWIDIAEGSVVLVSSHSIKRVKRALAHLCEEKGTTKLQGFQVAKELGIRLPQLDMFEDI